MLVVSVNIFPKLCVELILFKDFNRLYQEFDVELLNYSNSNTYQLIPGNNDTGHYVNYVCDIKQI